MTKPIVYLHLTDVHFPYHDEKAVDLAFRFAKRIQPDTIITSEFHDFYSVSRFLKDPTRIDTLQDEIDGVNDLYATLRKYCPNSRIILLNSNHLVRLSKYIKSNAPGLHSLRDLKLKNLLKFKENGIIFKENHTHRNFLFKHGDLVRKYTSAMEFARENMSGQSGHTHKIANFYTTKRSGSYSWSECGCLCDPKQEYMEGAVADWQQGFGLVTFWVIDSTLKLSQY